MWVEALLARDDLEKAARALCPLRIELETGGNLSITEPRDLVLVASIGLRLTVTVELHWPILGIQVPVSVRAATLEVRPQIVEKPEGDELTFKLHLDDLDLSIFPDFVDRRLVDRVNAEHLELPWRFTKTLSHVFALPAALASAAAIDLRATWGSVKITKEALVLAVSFCATVQARAVEPGKPPRRRLTKGRATSSRRA